MIEYLNFNQIDIIATRVSGKISADEFHVLMKHISDKINTYGRISWYYEMNDFKGWNWEAFWKDIKFSLKNKDKFERVAFVGENLIEDIMAQFSKLFTPADIKYFPVSDRESAIEWIKYGIEKKDDS